jgi:hypothetical protein
VPAYTVEQQEQAEEEQFLGQLEQWEHENGEATDAQVWRMLETVRDGGSIWEVAPHDRSSHEGRVALGVERAADLARDESGEPYDPAPPSRESYDLDRVEDRHAFMADRLAGADVEGMEHRSSEDREEMGSGTAE